MVEAYCVVSSCPECPASSRREKKYRREKDRCRKKVSKKLLLHAEKLHMYDKLVLCGVIAIKQLMVFELNFVLHAWSRATPTGDCTTQKSHL